MIIKLPDDLLIKSNAEMVNFISKFGPEEFAKSFVRYLTTEGGLEELKKNQNMDVIEKMATTLEVTIALLDLKRFSATKESKPAPIINKKIIDDFLSVYEANLKGNNPNVCNS